MLEIGSTLREARRRRGLGLDEVEAATMIRVRYLDALEREQLELLPPDPYGRSFLREYAEFLGLDGDILASEYELRVAPPQPEPQSPPRRPAVGFARRLGELPLIWTGAVLAAAALVGLGAWQLDGSGGTRAPTPNPSPPATHVRRPPAAATPPPERSPPVLTLTAVRGSCWLSVRLGSSTGPTVYEQTLQAGHTERFVLSKPLWVRAGAPWNLDATIGPRSVTSGLPLRTGDVLATDTGLHAVP
jgi:cytoskeletal protein RodZ